MVAMGPAFFWSFLTGGCFIQVIVHKISTTGAKSSGGRSEERWHSNHYRQMSHNYDVMNFVMISIYCPRHCTYIYDTFGMLRFFLASNLGSPFLFHVCETKAARRNLEWKAWVWSELFLINLYLLLKVLKQGVLQDYAFHDKQARDKQCWAVNRTQESPR